MRTFEHFPQDMTCPICKKNTDEETILIGIYGTQEGHNIQAVPVHTNCVADNLMYYKEQGMMIINCNEEQWI